MASGTKITTQIETTRTATHETSKLLVKHHRSHGYNRRNLPCHQQQQKYTHNKWNMPFT